MTNVGYFNKTDIAYIQEKLAYTSFCLLIKQCKSATAVTVLHPYIKTVVMIEPESS
jgi:hypothetical protein